MDEHPMETTVRTIVWRQFSAAIDMLENALVACPASLWRERVFRTQTSHQEAPDSAAFWSITYHILFWLDVYLTGSHEGFAPPAPFTLNELDPDSVFPDQPSTKEELHGSLVQLRQKCQTTLAELSDEQAHHQVTYPWWGSGMSMSFLELQLYNMRHVQEHAAHLSLFLGQHGIPDEALDWVGQAKGDPAC
jgi:uncharacterized damage-inducible protein DinB